MTRDEILADVRLANLLHRTEKVKNYKEPLKLSEDNNRADFLWQEIFMVRQKSSAKQISKK